MSRGPQPLIDLSQVVPPPVVVPPDVERIIVERKAAVVEKIRLMDADLAAEVEAILTLESEPMTKIEEAGAYRELLHYARVNEAALDIMLAFARGQNLDRLGDYYGVPRLVVTPADTANGTPALMEDDESYRRRVQLAPEALSTAGPAGAYVFHALSVSADVLDAGIVMPQPGRVEVHVVTRSGDGTPSPELLAAIAAHLRDDMVAPLTDQVSVLPPAFSDFSVEARLFIGRGPDPLAVKNAAVTALQAYLQKRKRIGATVPLSGIIAALHVAAVDHVVIDAPLADVVPAPGGFARLTAVAVTTEVMP